MIGLFKLNQFGKVRDWFRCCQWNTHELNWWWN